MVYVGFVAAGNEGVGDCISRSGAGGKMGFRYFTAVAVVALLTASANAQQIIFAGSGSQRTDGGIVAGSAFNAGGAKSINALGFIDVGNDGLAGSYQVGL